MTIPLKLTQRYLHLLLLCELDLRLGEHPLPHFRGPPLALLVRLLVVVTVTVYTVDVLESVLRYIDYRHVLSIYSEHPYLQLSFIFLLTENGGGRELLVVV